MSNWSCLLNFGGAHLHYEKTSVLFAIPFTHPIEVVPVGLNVEPKFKSFLADGWMSTSFGRIVIDAGCRLKVV